MSKKPPSKTSLWNILSQTSDDKKTVELRVYTKNFHTPQKFGPASQVRNLKITNEHRRRYDGAKSRSKKETIGLTEDVNDQTKLIDGLGEIRGCKRELEEEDKAIREQLDWGNQSKINGDRYSAQKRLIKKRFELKRVDGKPVIADWPADYRDQVLMPERVQEIIYVRTKK